MVLNFLQCPEQPPPSTRKNTYPDVNIIPVGTLRPACTQEHCYLPLTGYCQVVLQSRLPNLQPITSIHPPLFHRSQMQAFKGCGETWTMIEWQGQRHRCSMSPERTKFPLSINSRDIWKISLTCWALYFHFFPNLPQNRHQRLAHSLGSMVSEVRWNWCWVPGQLGKFFEFLKPWLPHL